jgi:septal ring factor EnvC (AmiA/AmiB activator)
MSFQKNIEMQERLYNMMREDFVEKDRYIAQLEGVTSSLLAKLKRRDETISELRAALKALTSDRP